MADNIRLSAGTGDGAYLAAAGLTVSGDAAEVQMVGAGILSGSEGSWTHSQLVGGAGAVAAGVQRVTLASDDPAVVDLAAIEVLLTAANVDHAANEALLTTIDTDTSAMVVDLAAIEVLLTAANVDHAANEVLLGTIDADTGAIKTALEIIDDWDESDRGKVNPIAGQAGIAANAGNMDALTTRVVVATNDTHFGTVGTASDIDGVVHGQLRYIADQLVTIDSDTNDIKTAVEILDNVVSGNEAQVDIVAALPAGTNTHGGVIGQQSTSVAYDGTTACTIKRKTGVAATGTVAMIAAVAGYQIRVLAIAVFATSATANTIRIHNDDNDLIGNVGNAFPIAADADGDNSAGFVLPWNQGGWFQTDTDNQSLDITLSAAQDVIYAITYIEVT